MSEALPTLAAMGDMYVFRPGDSDEWRAKREADERTLAEIRERWITYASGATGLGVDAARDVIATIFDHARTDEPCRCSCHPQFSLTHDGGFDCPCTWSDERHREARAAFFEDSPWRQEMRAAQERENAELAEWLLFEPGVAAERTCFAAPEVWEGTIDGRTFFFRERHGEWQIEVDLEPDGHFAERVVEVKPGGDMVTEPVELTSGPVIARGVEEDLGASAVDHLAFIVRRVRAHFRGESCTHPDARRFCPDCGRDMDPASTR